MTTTFSMSCQSMGGEPTCKCEGNGSRCQVSKTYYVTCTNSEITEIKSCGDSGCDDKTGCK